MKRLLTLALMATLFACGGNDSTGPATVTGTYHLSSAAGHSVPATIYNDGTTQVSLTAGTITLNGNNTWSGSITVHLVTGGVTNDETDSANGTWTQSGNKITLTDASDNSTIDATVGNNKLTAQIDFDLPTGEVTVVFTK